MEEETLKDFMSCRSMQEFKLRAEVTRGGELTAADFVEITEKLADNPEFMPVLSDAVKAGLFDRAFGEKDFYIDYYLATMDGNAPANPDDFAHLPVLDAFTRARLEQEWGSWQTLPGKVRARLNRDLAALYDLTVKKLRQIHGDLALISNFSRMKFGTP